MTRFRLCTLILAILIIVLQYDFWIGSLGLPTVISLNHEVRQLQSQNQKLELRNHMVYDEVLSLRHDNAVIESLARRDLGFIAPGETFYQIVPKELVAS